MNGNDTNTKGTEMNAIDTTRRDGAWVCYRCTSTRAVELFRDDDLDVCREWASLSGYDGIVIGSPSLPWQTNGYAIGYVNPNGDFDIVEEFQAESEAAANAYAATQYADDEDWYVLNSEGHNINGDRS